MRSRLRSTEKASKLAKALAPEVHYTVDEKQKSILITEDGYEAAEDVLQVGTSVLHVSFDRILTPMMISCKRQSCVMYDSLLSSCHATAYVGGPAGASLTVAANLDRSVDIACGHGSHTYTLAQVTDLYDPREQWASYLINAIKAKELQKRDVNYIVKEVCTTTHA